MWFVTTSTATTPAVTPTTPTTVVWSYVDFDWNIRGDRLIIYYYDGDVEYLYYGYDRNGDLIMATDSHFYHYTAYRPAGMYYEPAKDVWQTPPRHQGQGEHLNAKGPRHKAREALVEK